MENSESLDYAKMMLKGLNGLTSDIEKQFKQRYQNNPEALKQFEEALKNPALKQAAEDAAKKIIESNNRKRD
jgi:uncharacterized Zn finger protein